MFVKGPFKGRHHDFDLVYIEKKTNSGSFFQKKNAHKKVTA